MPESLGAALEGGIQEIDLDIREGRFQRWLSLIAGLSSALSGLEVAYERYRGSYSRRVMYTPVVLSGALAVSGLAGFLSRRAARTVLPAISLLTLADSVTGFYFHIRGVQRKPGGWRLPVVNIIMGPPIFAPLLFGVSAYLGLLASLLRRVDQPDDRLLPLPAQAHHWAKHVTGGYEVIGWAQDVREGSFQKQLAIATVIAAFFSGFEAWYSHYKNNFRYKTQWTPVIIAPMLMAAGMGAVKSRRAARILSRIQHSRSAEILGRKTREVVLDRVNNVPEIRFFSQSEVRLLKAICDRVLP